LQSTTSYMTHLHIGCHVLLVLFTCVTILGCQGLSSGSKAIPPSSNSGSGTSAGSNSQGTLTVNPASLNFGSVPAGKKLTLSESLINTGSAELTVSQATVTGSGFSINGLSTPLALEPGQSFTFGATFAPRGVGNDSGAISFVSDASDPRLTVPVAGGAPDSQLTVFPTSINFGNVAAGSQAQQTSTLTASSTNVTVSSVNMNGSEFAISGVTFPLTIPAGQSVTFTVTFAPHATGPALGRAFFASDANSPTVQSLAGQGVSALQPQVYLSWIASSSPNVIGYNVYRGTQHGGPYPMKVASLDPNTKYTDSSVASGQTYYYVATTVNAKNVESGYSNEVQAVIHSP